MATADHPRNNQNVISPLSIRNSHSNLLAGRRTSISHSMSREEEKLPSRSFLSSVLPFSFPRS